MASRQANRVRAKACRRSVNAKAKELIRTAIRLAKHTSPSHDSFNTLRISINQAQSAQSWAHEGECRGARMNLRASVTKLRAAKQMMARERRTAGLPPLDLLMPKRAMR